MINFHEKPSKILAWLNAKGHRGTLSDALDSYIRSGSGLSGGTTYDQLMFRLGGTGTLDDRLATMFQTKTGVANYKEATRAFFQNTSLDMFGVPAYSFIASAQAVSSNLNNVTTSAIDTSGADFIVILATSFPIGTVTDSKSNTWTAMTEYSNGTASVNVRFFYCVNPTVGSGHTFTLTQASGAPSVSVLAFSGAAASPVDQQNGTGTFNGVTSVATGSITPSEANCLIVAGLGGGATTGTWTADSGMTNVGYLNTAAGQGYGTGIAYKIQTTAAAINATWSSGVAGSGAVNIASFKNG